MIPAGYLLKHTNPLPGWFNIPGILEVCSVASCANENVIDIERIWEHNAFGVANSAEMLWRLAREGAAETNGSKLFYYETYELETDSDEFLRHPVRWRPLTPVPSGKAEATLAAVPEHKRLLGYDVVVFEDYLEHSPLSCNGMAAEIQVNEYCLISTFDDAKEVIEAGRFRSCEPGKYKIYSVYLVE